MFLSSVLNGLIAFFDWHVIAWVFAITTISVTNYVIGTTVLPNFIVHSNKGHLLAMCSWLFTEIILAIAISLFVLFCLPYLIGIGGFLPLPAARVIWWPFTKIALTALLLVLILSILPVTGRAMATIPGVPLFFQGLFIAQPLTREVFYAAGISIPKDWFPGFWACAGYIVVGTVLAILLTCLGTIVSNAIQKKRDPAGYQFSLLEQKYGQGIPHSTFFEITIAHVAGTIAGILPLLMYGRYVSVPFTALLQETMLPR